MAWIESHSTLIEHPKVREAARLLDIKPVVMVGHLHCFWHKVIELREDGDISQWTEEDIAYYAKWENDPKLFYETLKKRFIDEKNDLKLVHDWLDYAYKYLYSKYHTNNPKLLKQIKKKHNYKGDTLGQPKGMPKGHLPNQPNLTNLTNNTPPEEIYEYYAKTIKSGAKEDAIKSIARLLKTGVSKDDLLGRIDAYRAKLTKDGTEQRFYIQANNFFGKAARYKDYEPVKKVDYKKADPDCKICQGQGVVLIENTGNTKVCDCRIYKTNPL